MKLGEGSYSRRVPKLKGWLTFPEAGTILGVSKQMIHKMAFLTEPPVLKTVRSIGDRPIYIVSEEEVMTLKKSRKIVE